MSLRSARGPYGQPQAGTSLRPRLVTSSSTSGFTSRQRSRSPFHRARAHRIGSLPPVPFRRGPVRGPYPGSVWIMTILLTFPAMTDPFTLPQALCGRRDRNVEARPLARTVLLGCFCDSRRMEVGQRQLENAFFFELAVPDAPGCPTMRARASQITALVFFVLRQSYLLARPAPLRNFIKPALNSADFSS